jgi:hypothetical protein
MESAPIRDMSYTGDVKNVTIEDYDGNIFLKAYDYPSAYKYYKSIIENTEKCNEGDFSTEGSDGNKHSDKPVLWKGYPDKTLNYELWKSSSYFKSVPDLKLSPNQLLAIENKVFERIYDTLNGGLIHGTIHGGILSECDFGGRDFGRLLYVADTNPPAVYFGYAFKRSKMGHVPEDLAKRVIQSISDAKVAFIAKKKKEEDEAE